MTGAAVSHGRETRPASLPACTQQVSSLLSRTHPGTAPLTGGWPSRPLGPVRPGQPSGPGPGLCNNASRAAPRTGQLGGVLLLSTPRGWVMMEPPSKAGSQGPGPAMPVGATRGRLGQVRAKPPGEAGRRPGHRGHGLPSALDSSSLFCLAPGSAGSRGRFRGRLTQPGRLSRSRRGPGMGEAGWDGGEAVCT